MRVDKVPEIFVMTNPREHSSAVAHMFGGIARFYDLLNRILSIGLDQYWRKELARNVLPGEKGLVLDLAAGTLDVSLAIRHRFPQTTVLAFDFCLPMLRLGRPKLRGDNKKMILPVAADALSLPLADCSVDCITIAFGIRNILPRHQAFREMLRVLRPGGRACILEFGSGRERIWGGLYNLYLNRVLPGIGAFFSKDKEAYQYLSRTICAFPEAPVLEKEMQEAGFVRTGFSKLTSGIVCLHLGEKPV
ncbi:MAG: ubiquinone/menaquinone biosynthesis methyltransferase [Desulfovibrio sp.]|nr:ubiquinone/menaquinone biosynthesis methyltransferase [Desulfovibrio sp.]